MRFLLYILIFLVCLINIKPAMAENWVEFDFFVSSSEINTDSITFGNDGYYYFTIRDRDGFGSGEYEYSDAVLSCDSRELYYKNKASGSFAVGKPDETYLGGVIKTVCPH